MKNNTIITIGIICGIIVTANFAYRMYEKYKPKDPNITQIKTLVKDELQRQDDQVKIQPILELLDKDIKQSILLEKCPADIFNLPNKAFTGNYAFCENNPSDCLSGCKAGDANQCFTLGYSLQQKRIDDNYAEYLFALSCQQGLAIGCTNRAAHIKSYDSEKSEQSCVFETFKKTCELNDSWGCLMYGNEFLQAGNKNIPLAKQLFKKACDIEPDNESCHSAKKLLKLIEAE